MKAGNSAGRFLRNLPLALTVVTALVLPSSASAGTLDQQQTMANNDAGLFTTSSLAQTFTAGATGALDQVDLLLFKIGAPPFVVVQVRDVVAGNPGNAVLATAILPASGVSADPSGAYAPFSFPTPAQVTAGTQYAIVAFSSGVGGNVAAWRRQSTGNPYLGGTALYSTDPLPPTGNWTLFPDADQTFKTYVAPPVALTAAPTVAPTVSGGPTGQRAAALKKCKKQPKKKRKKCRKKAAQLPA